MRRYCLRARRGSTSLYWRRPLVPGDQRGVAGTEDYRRIALAKWYPELGPNASLWCATEMTTREQMDAVAEALRMVAAESELTRA